MVLQPYQQESILLKLDCEGTVFVSNIMALLGNPSILGRFPANLESACIRIVGESGGRRDAVIGCGETGCGEW
jgi:hypothetical protein